MEDALVSGKQRRLLGLNPSPATSCRLHFSELRFPHWGIKPASWDCCEDHRCNTENIKHLRASVEMKKAARSKGREVLGPRSLAVTKISM